MISFLALHAPLARAALAYFTCCAGPPALSELAYVKRDAALIFEIAESSLVMNFTIEFFRSRPSDEAHATLDRISIGADNLNAATVKAKSLFVTLDMPQKPDGLRILDQVKRELFVWKPDDHDA